MRTFTFTALAAALAFAPALAMAAPPPPSAPVAPSPAAPAPTPPPTALPSATAAGHGAAPGAAPAPAAAAEVSVPDKGFLSRTSELDRQIQILERKAKIADLQKKIDGSDTHAVASAPAALISTPPTNLAGTGTTTTPVSTAVVAPPAPKAPKSLRLVGVAEIGTAAQATIVDNGIPVQVQVGSVLPSGWHVTNITSTGATLARGRAHRSLAIGD